MRILVTDTKSLGSLATYLRRCGCTVHAVGSSAVEASPTPLQGVTDAYLRMQLDAYVRVWVALHPGVSAAIEGQTEPVRLRVQQASGLPVDDQ
jgi:hypothetical protein